MFRTATMKLGQLFMRFGFWMMLRSTPKEIDIHIGAARRYRALFRECCPNSKHPFVSAEDVLRGSQVRMEERRNLKLSVFSYLHMDVKKFLEYERR